MFKNRRPAPRTPTSRFPSKTSSKLRGAFENGQWLCDCEPRLPAEHFQVKKEGKNKGRWFYTCQKHESERCGFFLWDDDAKPRMEAAVLSNSTTEPTAVENNGGVNNGEQRKSKKRTLPWEECPAPKQKRLSDGGSFDMSDGEEKALSQAARTMPNPPETPRKVQKTTAFETASSKSKNVITPQAGVRYGLATPGTTPHQANTAKTVTQDPPETPTPIRTSDVMGQSSNESALPDKVFKLLSLFDVKLDPNASSALQGLLNSEHRRHQGTLKGRDSARAAVHTRDMRIAELVDRCGQLEGENEAHKALVKHLRGQ